MLSFIDLRSSRGLPLCVSGIAQRLALSIEIEDHDRRREDIKRKQSLLADSFTGYPFLVGDRMHLVTFEKEKEAKNDDEDDLTQIDCARAA